MEVNAELAALKTELQQLRLEEQEAKRRLNAASAARRKAEKRVYTLQAKAAKAQNAQEHDEYSPFGNHDLLGHCLDFALSSLSEWASVKLVCSDWRACVMGLSCHPTARLKAHLLHQACAAFPNLTQASLHSSRSADTDLQAFAPLQALTRVDLGGCSSLLGNGLCHLTALPVLTSLSLMGCCGLMDEGLKPLGRVVSLTELDLTGCVLISDRGVMHLSSLSNLAVLCLSELQGLTGQVFGKLVSGLTSLRALDLSQCLCLKQQWLGALSHPSLQSLDLSCSFRSKPVGRVKFGALPRLTSLQLWGVELLARSDLSSLVSACPMLTSLDVSCCFVNAEGLRNLCELRSLRSLKLGSCSELSDRDFLSWKGNLGITELDLSQCMGITPDCVSVLATVAPLLRLLDLSETRMDDSVFAHFSSFSCLECLDLRYCRSLTGEGLSCLGVSPPPSLVTLRIPKPVDKKSLSTFHAEFPQCSVYC